MPNTFSIEQQAISTIRLLAVDMVEKAKSGHPGLPLGAAPMAYTLFTKIMRFNPANPEWPNRDRFVLSAGHGSALLYALLHLCGYGLGLDELKQFRQLGSRTPGHPEYGETPGVEMTTGPLGQGIATAVGVAAAERFLAAKLNTAERALIEYFTYVICGDGDLMEGVSSEASSLAGHLKLGKLICLYDSNHITIEGSTALAFTENVAQRYEAYGWHVISHIDGTNLDAIERAVRDAQEVDDRPSLIIVSTTIGYGSPHKQGTASAHGEPLGPDEAKLVKRAFGFPEDASFVVPDEVRSHFRAVAERGIGLEQEWKQLWKAFGQEEPDLASALSDLASGRFPASWLPEMPAFTAGEKLATRQASKKVLGAIAEKIPLLAGGSADLAPSNGTLFGAAFEAGSYGGATLHFGVREHAMGAMVNGLALSNMVIPYGATFLIFADYMKPALRLAALMQTHSLFIFTHDSIGVGEDGPTHQPIEQLAMLRAMPGFDVYRPADANETAAAWLLALERRKPAALVLTRQGLPVLDDADGRLRDGVPKGAYVLADWAEGAEAEPGNCAIIVATGSEVHPALEAKAVIEQEGYAVRVVSMPSKELFAEQSAAYRQSVLPPNVTKRVVVEAATTFGWHDVAGSGGTVIGLDRFGASAPGPQVMEHFGFTASNIAEKALELLKTGEA
ncbi:transketolase [Chlorobaculum sp. 24CR]|uniref:transketolase n=1 Tax=Chlorobaculum sp. 24CR TaxID=2508878 RepID=UPI00100BD257|nr:transketolase [Chlorobaculum sp. 24CR]RXK85063.1 transketolase [Chlorobaculum sp. 24CR]